MFPRIPFSNEIKVLLAPSGPTPPPLEKPKVLQFPVNDICNSRCQMCLIWEKKQDIQITPEQLRTGLRNPLFSDVRSVGINGGEPTLRKDLAELVEVLYTELPSLRNIALITNAINKKAVCARIDEIGDVVADHHGHLDVMVSLDGYGEVHDRVRCKPGNFASAEAVIAHAKASARVGNLRIGCTIIRDNALHLPDLLEYCIANELYVKFRLGVPHQRLYTADLKHPFALSAFERYEVVQFLGSLTRHYETGEKQNYFYRSLIDQIAFGAPRRAGCDWQFQGATLSARGELLYCAVQSSVLLPDIAAGDAEKAYFGHRQHLQGIIDTKCAQCAHDYVGPLPRRLIARQLLQKVVRRLDPHDLRKPLLGNTQLKKIQAKRRFAARKAHYRQISLAAKPQASNARSGVLICGWYGTETLGDKAILATVVTAIRDNLGLDTPIAVASLQPYLSEITKSQMPELDGVTVVSVEAAFGHAKRCDYLIFGGGPLMAIANMAEMLELFRMAKQAGATTILAGCGIGPLGSPPETRAIADLLALSDYRIYRDERSRQLAQTFGIDTAHDTVAEDPAFAWIERQEASTETAACSAQNAEPPVLLLGLREFPATQYAYGASVQEQQRLTQSYEAAVITTLEQLMVLHPRLIIRPFPMCTNQYGGDDRWFFRRLFRGRPALARSLETSLLGPELAPTDYLTAFFSASAVLAMRFHSLVFALGTQRPVVAIDYTSGTGKVSALATRYSVPHQSIADLDSKQLTDLLDQSLCSSPRSQIKSTSFSAQMAKVFTLATRPPKPAFPAATTRNH